MRILIVAPDCPWPPDHGGRVAVLEHIRALNALRHEVHLVATSKKILPYESMPIILRELGDIKIVPRTRSPFDMLSHEPFQLVSRKILSRLHLDHSYDVVILEGCYVAPILRNSSLRAKRIFYRVHNHEASYFENLATSSHNPFMKAFYKLEACRIGAIEKSLIERADTTLFISQTEMVGKFGRDAKNPVFLPHAINPTTIKLRPLKGRSVLFIGSLFMVNNQRAVRWYLQNVHQHLLDLDGYRLIIAGRADENLGAALRNEWSQPQLDLFISPENLDVLYEQASVFINPAQETAGVKVKIIEAVRNGLPVVTTSQGLLGSGLQAQDHVLVAETAATFSGALRALLEGPLSERKALADRAAQFLREHYDMQKNLQRLYEGAASLDD